MASKKCCFFEKRFQQGKKFGGKRKISCRRLGKRGPFFCRHYGKRIICSKRDYHFLSASFRKGGHSYIENVYSAGCLIFNWCLVKVLSFEHQTAGTRRKACKYKSITNLRVYYLYSYGHKIIPKIFIIFHSEKGARHSSPTDSFIGFTCRYSHFLFQGFWNALRTGAFSSPPGSVSISLREIETEPMMVISIIPKSMS